MNVETRTTIAVFVNKSNEAVIELLPDGKYQVMYNLGDDVEFDTLLEALQDVFKTGLATGAYTFTEVIGETRKIKP